MKTRGFSLLELVVTMVIAGILAAIAIPYFTDTDAKSTWYAEQVRAAARYAQRQAVAQRRVVYFVAQLSKVEVCYAVDISNHCVAGQRLTQVTDGGAYSLAAPSGVTINPETTVSFTALGVPSGAASFSVGGHAVSVTAETGYVQ